MQLQAWLCTTISVAIILGSQNVEARGSPFGLFAFPQTRRGRATKTLLSNDENGNKVLTLGENNSDDAASAILDSITISKDANEEDDIIQKLVDSLVSVSDLILLNLNQL